MVAPPLRRFVVPVGLGLSLLAVGSWAYWTTLAGLAETWSRDPNYSQGFLIPGLALAILGWRLRGTAVGPLRPDWWGPVVVLVATGLRLLGAYYYVTPLDHLSLLLVLAGVCLTVGGLPLLRPAWPAIVFLLFMIPIPQTFGGSDLTAVLQRTATAASTWMLQTLGLPAQREGNVILMSEVELGIVEACSGLRMLMVFCALATATAVLLRRGVVQRLLVVLSAIPLAVTCNVIRITAAGVVNETVGSEAAHAVFHDVAGWLMAPLACGFLALELGILCRVFLPADDQPPALRFLTLTGKQASRPVEARPRPVRG